MPEKDLDELKEIKAKAQKIIDGSQPAIAYLKDRLKHLECKQKDLAKAIADNPTATSAYLLGPEEEIREEIKRIKYVLNMLGEE